MSKDPFFEREDKKFFEKWLGEAQQGSAIAIYMVAECFYNGKGTYKNINEAAKWYKLAAEGGNLSAQSRLNEMFAKGETAENFVPKPSPTKKTSTSIFTSKKKSSTPKKKSYDGNFGNVDARYNNEKFGYEDSSDDDDDDD